MSCPLNHGRNLPSFFIVDGTYADRGTTFVVHDALNGNQTNSTLNAAPQSALALENNFVLFTNVHVSGGNG